MTRAERWIYRDLIEVYYDKEQPLTLNVAELCRDIGVRSDEEKSIVADLLSYKFTKTENGYVHDVCERVIDEYRAKADTARENGKKGGRPKKAEGNQEKPGGFPVGSESVSTANPEETGSEANQEPITNNQTTKPKNIRAPRFDAQAHLESLGVEPKVARDWLRLRKEKRLAPTETAFEGVLGEAKKAGISMNDALLTCCKRGWGGFEAKWISDKPLSLVPNTKQSRHSGFDNIDYRDGVNDDGSF
ncbi:uncharacterized protein YdaU (DUF1376 family) [Paraburkholderia youngii]